MRSPIYLYILSIFHLAVLCGCQKEKHKSDFTADTYSQNQLIIEQIAHGELEYNDSVEILVKISQKLNALDSGFGSWKQDSVLALAYDKMGGYLVGVSQYQAAINSCKRALNIYKLKWKGTGDKNILRMYHNIGVILSKNNDPHKAIPYFDSAGIDADRLKPDFLFSNPFRKAQCYSNIGAYSNASSFFQIAESWLANPDLKGLIKTKSITEFFVSYSTNYRYLAEYSKGIELANIGLHQIENCQDHLPVYFADLYTSLGNLWQDSLLQCRKGSVTYQKVLDNSILFLKKALNSYQQIPDVNDRSLRSNLAIGNLGELLRRAGQLDEAERVLNQGLDSLSLNPFDSILLSQLHINRGETFFDQKKYKKALNDYDQALACLVPNYKPTKNGQLPALNLPIRDRNDFQLILGDIALTNLSLWEEGKGKDPNLLQRAATVYDTLLKSINITRGDFISDDEKLNLAQKSQLTLRKAAWCSAKLAELFPKRKDYYWQQAFQIAEQSKAFALIEAARLKNVSNNLDPAFRAEEQDLLEQYSLIENELLSARNDPKRLAVLTVDKSEVVDKIRIHQQRLKQQYPNYYALKYRGADLSVDKIQKQVLGADQALVAYYFQDSALNIFVVTTNTFLLKSVPIREDSLQSLVNTYLELLSSNRSNKEAAIAKYGSQLYSTLLQPVAGMLSERLILVPAGPLNNLPFEALLMRPQVAPFKEQLRAKNFVLSRYAISYCFSANLLYEMQQAQLPQQVRSIPAIMAADFQQFQAGKASGQPNLSSFLRQSASYLTPLGIPQKQEVDGIVKVIPQAQKYLKLSATKKDFFAASKNSSIIHAPTHGILNPTDPSQSFIAFSQHGDSLRRSELLFVNELYSRFLNVDLIFLSACQTATGKFIAGEGNISLGRGLAYAGVRSFISTLWNVPVAPKASIAADFYQSFLLKHQPKDVALAQAKRLAAEQYPDPNDWAGFVLQGACLPAAQKTNYWLIAGVGLALLFLLVFGLRMMAKRRKSLARA